MPLQKQPLNINFSQGLETKSDPKQVPPGKFLSLTNTVFGTDGLLQKRNGFGLLTSLTGATTVANYNDSLVLLGPTLRSYSSQSGLTINSGSFQPIEVDSQSLVRSATSQTTCDVAIHSGGLSVATWLDSDGNSYYQIVDSLTGLTVVPKVQLPATATMPRAFLVGRYFIVTFQATVAAAPHLQYIAIPVTNPSVPLAAVDIATTIVSITSPYDAIVANDTLYTSWNGSDMGSAIRTRSLSSTLAQSTAVALAGQEATYISVTADTSGSQPVIWVTFYLVGTNTIKVVAYSSILVIILTTTTAVSSITINEVTTIATGNVLTIFYEVASAYSYSPNAKSDILRSNTVTIAGVVGSPALMLNGVGIASKPFYYNSVAYLLITYGQTYQPTYFLINSSSVIVAKLAYSNGAGYLANQIIPSPNVNGDSISVGYLFKDLLASVNKTQGVANVSGVYSQTGINLATFTFDSQVQTANIANDLHMTGGILWMYDGVKPVEHGFHVWPEDIVCAPATSGGSMADQVYYYKVCYEWTDNQGNIHRSAPSVPAIATVSGGSGSGSVVVNIPYLRITQKTANKVRLVIYRWSTAQQTYYRITSITSPQLNAPGSQSLAFTDTLADSSILGNDIIYTNGGVIENIAAPACIDLCLFKSRLVLIDAEDRNLLWYSKQCISSVPVEMSDLFTIFVAPTTGAQGSTGPCTAISAMDDKLIIFKQDGCYYVTGNGPDNTGSNNDFSDPTFIAGTVGSTNKKSIVLTPDGLMFQSDKGIWLLNRNLQTSYIGAPVQAFNNQTITSAVCVPGTNQVRFTLDDRVTLMYDYYEQQWGSFSNLPALSSCVFEGLHTYLNSSGQLLQETPGLYVDVSSPVLIGFTTSWFNLAGLQGYERAYFMYLLANYISPHKLTVQIAYDYGNPSQTVVISPTNYTPNYGDETLYAGGVYGGVTDKEQWRVFFDQQKCQAFQLTVTESFDNSFGVAPGAGLTISGLDLTVGIKDGKPRLASSESVG